MKKYLLSTLVAAITVFSAARARADILAVYAEGHGGMNSCGCDGGGAAPGLGFQLGGRLLIFEGYLDHTNFGDGAKITRGIGGLRGGIGLGDLRLVLRAGAGVIHEEGGALTGRTIGAVDQTGAVARAGVALESHVSNRVLVGFGLDGERFLFQANGPFGQRVTGSDVFASLKLTFELGI